jgi:hypothetical protein
MRQDVATLPAQMVSPGEQAVALHIADSSFSRQNWPAVQCCVGVDVAPSPLHVETLPLRQKVLFGTHVTSLQTPAVHSLSSPQSDAVRQSTHLPRSTSHSWRGQSVSSLQMAGPASESCVPASVPASGLELGFESS